MKTLLEFLEENANPNDLCYYYDDYPEEIQQCVENIYKGCIRFGLLKCQIVYMLNALLKPLEEDYREFNDRLL